MSSIDSHGMGAIGNIQINGSHYKITGLVPNYLCFAIIENYLSSVIYELSEYYELTEDEEQIAIFTKMTDFSLFLF